MGRRTYTDEQLIDAAHTSNTMGDVIARLGLVPRGGNYEAVRQRMVVLGLDVPKRRKLTRGRPLSSCSKEEVVEAVRNFVLLLRSWQSLAFARVGTRAAYVI